MLKYGITNTYTFLMDENLLNEIAKSVNMSKNQVLYIFQLVDGDTDKLFLTLEKMKNIFYMMCPLTKEEVQKILNTETKNNWFKIAF